MMETIKTVLVTGATGNQGSAVARNLVNNGFKVKALTRDPASKKAQKLIHPGIEYVKGDLSDVDSYRAYMQDVDAVFSVLSEEFKKDIEIKQGKDIADLAKTYGVSHFLYSSVGGAHLHTGIPHWESKYEIENHIKNIGLPYSIVRPSSLYENFLIPQVKSGILKGKLVTPVGKEVVQQFIGADDIGKMCVRIFRDPTQYLNQTITLAAEQMDNIQVAKIFSDVMGREIKYQKLPSIITRLVMGKDLYKMFNWVNKHNGIFINNLEVFRREYPWLQTLKEWININFTKA